jgi:hypothetical protein
MGDGTLAGAAGGLEAAAVGGALLSVSFNGRPASERVFRSAAA